MHKSTEYIRKYFCLFFGIVFSTMLHAQSIDQLIKKFDKSIDSLHTLHEFNGNILLVKNGQKLYEKSIGFTDSTTKHALTISSAFNLASISKTFTATAILQLKQKSKLKLDDVVQKYLPTFPYANITIRHLLSNTSGLVDYYNIFDSVMVEFPNKLITNRFKIII